MAAATMIVLLLALVSASAGASPCQDKLTECTEKGGHAAGDMCTNFAVTISCLSGSRDICPLEESGGVTFKSLQTVAKNSCVAISSLELQECNPLQECVNKTTFIQHQMGDNKDIQNDILKTDAWCNFLQGTLRCVIENKDKCSLENSKVQSVVNQRDKVNKVCSGGSGTIQGQLLITGLALLSAVVLLWQ